MAPPTDHDHRARRRLVVTLVAALSVTGAAGCGEKSEPELSAPATTPTVTTPPTTTAPPPAPAPEATKSGTPAQP